MPRYAHPANAHRGDSPGNRRGQTLKLVVDTDVIAAALLAEAGRSDEARTLITRSWQFLAPSHWKAEFANVIWKGVLRGRVPIELIEDLLDAADRLTIESVDIGELWGVALARAVAANHPVYDTLFVALALRERTFVASYDAVLRRRFPTVVRSPGQLMIRR
jgi:predicted nucleic acid-binding protein